ncbi:MAG: DUF3830 family protein [Solirubrobacteraceae bacterium]|nr:DUF3830 family protein [Solirubrobacteraceae bacterium]
MTLDTEVPLRTVRLTAGGFEFGARLEERLAPRTCEVFSSLLPFSSNLIHARWCGEASWIPLGDRDFGVPYENATSYPAPGDVLLYPGKISETEILVTYGAARFASKVGTLAGNHFLTIVEGVENLRRIGEATLWKGAHEIVFEAA